MPQGTVKFFKTSKGFGFIALDGGGNDVYIYINVRELEKTGLSSLVAGQKVIFDVEPDPKHGKLRAVNVRIEQ
jgi:cold shock protein